MALRRSGEVRWDMQRLKCRARYYYRKLCHIIGFCPSCYSRVNYLPGGRAICPQCKQR